MENEAGIDSGRGSRSVIVVVVVAIVVVGATDAPGRVVATVEAAVVAATAPVVLAAVNGCMPTVK